MPTFLTYSTPRIAKTLPVTLAVLVFCQVQRANAQIVTDGTMGRAGALTGPNYDIGAELGKLYGSNLFHSFSEFNLQNGQSANFSGPASVRNILSRVTGGSPSSIDGSINSSIKGANLFFINPSGVIFGAHAQVNVSGSFVASTANVLKLADGSVFSATDPGNSVLSSAAPAAFGFLNANPAAITLNGAQLKVGAGKTLSLVGGDLQLNGASLGAEKGAINLVSVGSPGEVAFDDANPATQPTLTGFNKLGAITMDGATVDVGDNTGGSGAGGNVTVRGGSLAMTNESAIQTRNRGDTSGGLIDIEVDGELELKENSIISSTALGSGAGANIRLKAGDINMTGPGFFDPVKFTGVRANTAAGATGAGGNVTVETGGLELIDGGRISAYTEGTGLGGNLVIHADRILLDGKNGDNFTGLAAQVLRAASGRGGNLDVTTGTLEIYGGAEVSTLTAGRGDGGTITIHASDILIDAAGADPNFVNGISASTNSFDKGGRGGNINLFTDALRMKNGGDIFVKTRGSGAGGDLNINAKSVQISNQATISAEVEGIGPGGSITINADDITLDGVGAMETTGIIATSFSGAESGKAGNITLNAKNLQVLHGGRILASTANGSAPGGNIDITADNVLVDGQNDLSLTTIASQSVDSNRGANGGSITMRVGTLRLRGGAEISAATNSHGNGGNINIEADKILMNGRNENFASLISASSGSLGSGGDGGKIHIKVKDLQLRGSSGITTNTRGTGQGGSITLEAGKILMDGSGTQIKSQSTGFDNTGNGGNIDVTADNLDMRNGGTITATTTGQGHGGTIEIKAGTLSLRTGASINAGTSGMGEGGDITIQAKDLGIHTGSTISAGTSGEGQGGTIDVTGQSIVLDGAGASSLTGIAAQTEGRGKRGDGGSVILHAGDLTITNGATVSTTTLGVGNGGDIQVHADKLNVTNSGSIQASSKPIEPVARNKNGGDGGDIVIDGGDFNISSGGSIATNALAGGGEGGNIVMNAAGSINVASGGSITAASVTSNGGDILLQAGDSIEVHDAQVTTNAGLDGGNIELRTARLIYLRNSLLSAIANGNGGNITIDPEAVVFDRSQVRADAINGNGGNILIRSRVFLPSIESIISASSQFGVAGNIAIESPNTNVGGSLIRLPDNPLDAESFLPERCVVRQTGQSSSFTVNTRRGAPPLPDDLSPSVAVK